MKLVMHVPRVVITCRNGAKILKEVDGPYLVAACVRDKNVREMTKLKVQFEHVDRAQHVLRAQSG